MPVPGSDYCALANARSIPLAQEISTRFGDPDRQAEIGELKIKISGCINACGHHHVGHIGLLGVEKKGAELYQITLGGSGDENTSIGEIIGRGFEPEKVTDAIETIVDTYLGLRKDAVGNFPRRLSPCRTAALQGCALRRQRAGSGLRQGKNMTKIWKETGFVTDDPWVIETEETKAGSNEKAILGLDAFIEKASPATSGLGVLINPADDVRGLSRSSIACAGCRRFPGLQRRPRLQPCLAAAGPPWLRQGNPRCRRRADRPGAADAALWHRQLRGHQRDGAQAPFRRPAAGHRQPLSADRASVAGCEILQLAAGFLKTAATV